jgi:hypothetical protein
VLRNSQAFSQIPDAEFLFKGAGDEVGGGVGEEAQAVGDLMGFDDPESQVGLVQRPQDDLVVQGAGQQVPGVLLAPGQGDDIHDVLREDSEGLLPEHVQDSLSLVLSVHDAPDLDLRVLPPCSQVQPTEAKTSHPDLRPMGQNTLNQLNFSEILI